MALSRLRLRLAAAFAVAFAIGLGVLTAGALAYLWQHANQRLDARLISVGREAVQAVQREVADAPDSSVAFAAHEVVAEWPNNDDSFVIVDERGAVLASADRARASASLLAALARSRDTVRVPFSHGDQDYHAVAAPWVAMDAKPPVRIRVIAFASTEGVERDTELLAGALLVAAPLIIFLSLAGGYVLARRALSPVTDLRAAIGAMAPGDLTRRLPVDNAQGEISGLAAEFNALLARLEDAQQRNRSFVREAAHQIRTPLTLVLGEAAHTLGARPAGDDPARAALARIRMAAEQMQHRVNELSLLAEAQAGEPVRLDDDVELDGLVLECTDLMRARATALGRALAIGQADHVVVRGNALLLREALVELLENACRHGEATAPVTVSAHANGERAAITVESAGAAFALPRANGSRAPDGLGLPIVEWIAQAHGGELRLARTGAINTLSLVLARGGVPQS